MSNVWKAKGTRNCIQQFMKQNLDVLGEGAASYEVNYNSGGNGIVCVKFDSNEASNLARLVIPELLKPF